jgi:hypothetical protein
LYRDASLAKELPYPYGLESYHAQMTNIPNTDRPSGNGIEKKYLFAGIPIWGKPVSAGW